MRALLLSLLLAGPQASSGVVTGQLYQTDGSPAVGVRVAALETSSRDGSAMMSVAQTDSAGRFRLDNVPPGTYYIVAGPTGSLQYYSEGRDAQPMAVAVRAGATVGSLGFNYNPWTNVLKAVRTRGTDQNGRFLGIIRKATGEPLQNVVVNLSHMQTGELFATNSDAAGAYAFPDLPGGRFLVQVLAPVQTGYNGMGYETFNSSMMLVPDESLQQDMRLRMIMSAAIALGQPQIYVANERPRRAADAPERVGGGTSIVRGGPQFAIARPQTGRGAKVEESVALQALVSVDGIVTSLRAISPDTNPDYVRAALQAVRQSKFTPPIVRGAPAEQFGVITVYFDR